MTDNAEFWLSAILKCGSADISILAGCEFDVDYVIKTCTEQFDGKLSLANLVDTIVYLGMVQIDEAIQEKVSKLERQYTASELETNDEYNTLKNLDPYEDIELSFNFLDTNVYIVNHEDEYKSYLKHECDMFEELTGFTLDL